MRYGSASPIIDLPDLEGELPLETKVFFIESSGRDHLLHRQACSVESALSVSKTIRSVVTLTARQLNLSHNATCQLYSRFNEPRLIFRRVDRAKIFKNTPIQPVFERVRKCLRNRLKGSMFDLLDAEIGQKVVVTNIGLEVCTICRLQKAKDSCKDTTRHPRSEGHN
ncbi:hypothetical protein TCAL_17248 [Tigriopus californicus]|uniref:Uncharacterized protein n=1 Tax=Tigriopus californicus TaxID=6832 RepID=A0A553NZN3_TIGCA|nr:hypothetical protein TCAL_17248 [Tigriopus californicus]